jgi:hypothetical protein
MVSTYITIYLYPRRHSNYVDMSKCQQTNREESGKLIQDNVKRLNDRNYQVKSATRDIVYRYLLLLLVRFAHVPPMLFVE